jgi:hypothetical protein
LRGHLAEHESRGLGPARNIASQKVGRAVVLQDLSDEPLPLNKGANANLGIFSF